MKKYRTIIILVVFIVINIAMFVGGRHWQAQKRQQFDEMIRQAERYAGATGDSITIFDNRTDRWIAEMKEEPIEVILQKLTDAMEHLDPGFGIVNPDGGSSLFPEEYREETIYRRDIEALLSNRRFRKAYKDLQKTNKKKSAELLTKNIRDNLAELRIILQEHIKAVSQGNHKGTIITEIGIPAPDTYRFMAHPDYPPTRVGRRYAVLSYILLASFLELREVRPAVEETIQFAKEEYKFFNSLDEKEAYSFMSSFLKCSLYNPSLLLTATLCDPTWNVDKHKRLETKLFETEIVDAGF